MEAGFIITPPLKPGNAFFGNPSQLFWRRFNVRRGSVAQGERNYVRRAPHNSRFAQPGRISYKGAPRVEGIIPDGRINRAAPFALIQPGNIYPHIATAPALLVNVKLLPKVGFEKMPGIRPAFVPLVGSCRIAKGGNTGVDVPKCPFDARCDCLGVTEDFIILSQFGEDVGGRLAALSVVSVGLRKEICLVWGAGAQGLGRALSARLGPLWVEGVPAVVNYGLFLAGKSFAGRGETWYFARFGRSLGARIGKTLV